MRQIKVDSNLHEAILEAWQTTELCDAEGNVIGKFVPNLDEFLIRHGIDPAEADRTATERMLNSSGKCYTTDQVLARLREKS
jgi:hypothetical protein